MKNPFVLAAAAAMAMAQQSQARMINSFRSLRLAYVKGEVDASGSIGGYRRRPARTVAQDKRDARTARNVRKARGRR